MTLVSHLFGFFLFRKEGMIIVKQEKALYNLVIASLLGTGYINPREEGRINKIHVPYEHEKRFYLSDYLTQYQLQNYVNVKERANEFNIDLSGELQLIVEKWFVGQEKTFKKNFLSKTDFQAIILLINLFGYRQIQGVSLQTNVNREYLFTLCFTIGRYLGVKTIISQNNIKIIDTMDLFLETVYKTTSFDSSNIANYLSKKEVKELGKSVNVLKENIRNKNYV